ncbi:MAG TPA: MerR family DNA-binding transcriptional regulator [Acidobacteriota bacterium]|nr:MerR family DNA-binding transcriptional regulator [Acidobacteriota bacterium]
MKEKYLRSGELAKLVGVSTDTLRHYERKGLIGRPRRSSNGYR